jgi:hypothetical protein
VVEGALKDSLVVLRKELAKDEVSRATTQAWTIYTDGAFEPNGRVKASVGAVLVNADGLVVERFG